MFIVPVLLAPEVVEAVAAVAGGVLTAVGGAGASKLGERLHKALGNSAEHSVTLEPALAIVPGTAKHPRFDRAKQQVETRIKEADAAGVSLRRTAKLGKGYANSLTFGQYIIGVTMGTSFMQQSLSPNTIGVFGVLVVVASALKQHFHPEVTAQAAEQRAQEFESLVRESQDKLVMIEATHVHESDNPEMMLDLLERVSSEIKRITAEPDNAVPIPRRRTRGRAAGA